MKVNLRFFLLTMTWIAVISDFLLHPFYPQFFSMRFGVTDPEHTGYFFAALCFMVMISFPFWAFMSKKINELNILVFTQLAAGIMALMCYQTESYVNFWIFCMIMILFKGSYLLVYPLILKITSPDKQDHTIGLMAVILHLGGIMGAVLGGFTVDFISAEYAFVIMALGDLLLMSTSIYLLVTGKNKSYPQDKTEESLQQGTNAPAFKNYILKIGFTTLILYFSDFLIRPFFSLFWEELSGIDDKVLSGAVYAIPGFVALIALWYNRSVKREVNINGILPALLLAAIGIMLQGIPVPALVLIGRLIFGWAIFQGDVRFDLLLFKHSTPENYATDYSKIHFFQNLGVLLASFSAGLLVDQHGLNAPFWIALPGVLTTLALYYRLFLWKPNHLRFSKNAYE